MAVITRRLEFDSGHRVLGHEGKCAHLHGHRYAAEISFEAAQLDNLGRVIDYGVIKELIGGWIDKHWDHNLLLNREDPLNQFHKSMWPEADVGISRFRRDIFAGKDPYIMERGNPTAENIAAELLNHSQLLLKGAGHHSIRITNVRIYETPNCWADCTPAMLQLMDSIDVDAVREELEKGPITAFQKMKIPVSAHIKLNTDFKPIPKGPPQFARMNVDVPSKDSEIKAWQEWIDAVPVGSMLSLVVDGRELSRIVKEADRVVTYDAFRDILAPMPDTTVMITS